MCQIISVIGVSLLLCLYVLTTRSIHLLLIIYEITPWLHVAHAFYILSSMVVTAILSIALKPRFTIGGKKEPLIDDYYEPIKDYINHQSFQNDISKLRSKVSEHEYYAAGPQYLYDKEEHKRKAEFNRMLANDAETRYIEAMRKLRRKNNKRYQLAQERYHVEFRAWIQSLTPIEQKEYYSRSYRYIFTAGLILFLVQTIIYVRFVRFYFVY